MRISQRGLVWVGVGIVVYVAGLLLDRPIVVRYTKIPLGLVIMGLGVGIVLWDAWKARHRKETPEENDRNKGDGRAGE